MNPFFVISIAFNIFFILCATLFTCYFYNLEVSSKMGDTIGGTLGPLLSIVAIVYVYKTYNDQREALNIQSRALENQKNDSLRQLSISLHSEMLNGLREAEIAFERISCEVPVQRSGNVFLMGLKSGMELLERYNRLIDTSNFFSKLRQKDEEFMSSILNAYQKLEGVLIRKVQSQSGMTAEHSNDLILRIKECQALYGKHVDEIFNGLTVYREMLPIGGEANQIEMNLSANRTMKFIKKYQSISSTFEMYNLKTRIPNTRENQEESTFTFDISVPVDKALRDSIDWRLAYE